MKYIRTKAAVIKINVGLTIVPDDSLTKLVEDSWLLAAVEVDWDGMDTEDWDKDGVTEDCVDESVRRVGVE